MDSYGLTDIEKSFHLHEYNHALFDNMKAFMDSCWEINLSTGTVVVLHEVSKPEYLGRQFEYKSLLAEFGEKYIYPLDRGDWYRMFSEESLLKLKNEQSFDLHVIGSSGIPEISRFILTPAFSDDGKIQRVYLSARNVEFDLKMLRELHEEKQIIFAAMGITYPIIIYSNLTCNSYMVYMLSERKMDLPMGGTYDSLINIISDSILPKYRDEYIELYSRENIAKHLTNDGQFVEIEYEQNMDGEVHWLCSKTVRINNPYSSDFMAITLISIIDEQRHNEYMAKMALQDAYNAALDAGKTKSEFLSRMSHEMLTPLNTIQCLVDIELENLGEDARLKRSFDEIGKAARQLSHQLSRLLDTSLLESETVTLSEVPAELTREVETAVAQMKDYADDKGLTFEITNELTHDNVICDPVRVGQIFNALLSNAVKFSRSGGLIKVNLKEGYGRRSGFGYYEFTVTDEGIGIRPEYIERIFEPFERVEDNRISRNHGSGLGLYIVRNISRLMGGNITVESAYEKGSEFKASFFLKLAAEQRTYGGAAESAAPEKISFAGKRILVVEDNELNNELIAEILREMEFEVECVFDGKQAIDLVLSTEPYHFDVILMDIMMPIVDGYEATRVIRASGREDLKRIPIIAASANSYPSDIDQSLKSGMNDHLAKPIESVSLAKILRQWINRTEK